VLARGDNGDDDDTADGDDDDTTDGGDTADGDDDDTTDGDDDDTTDATLPEDASSDSSTPSVPLLAGVARETAVCGAEPFSLSVLSDTPDSFSATWAITFSASCVSPESLAAALKRESRESHDKVKKM